MWSNLNQAALLLWGEKATYSWRKQTMAFCTKAGDWFSVKCFVFEVIKLKNAEMPTSVSQTWNYSLLQTVLTVKVISGKVSGQICASEPRQHKLLQTWLIKLCFRRIQNAGTGNTVQFPWSFLLSPNWSRLSSCWAGEGWEALDNDWSTTPPKWTASFMTCCYR